MKNTNPVNHSVSRNYVDDMKKTLEMFQKDAKPVEPISETIMTQPQQTDVSEIWKIAREERIRIMESIGLDEELQGIMFAMSALRTAIFDRTEDLRRVDVDHSGLRQLFTGIIDQIANIAVGRFSGELG